MILWYIVHLLISERTDEILIGSASDSILQAMVFGKTMSSSDIKPCRERRDSLFIPEFPIL
jgi:hypothetical protein